MTDGDGQPVNALYGFGRFLGDLLEEARPEHVAVAFDESLATSFRNAIYPAYKKNREPAPPELKRQFGLCRELCRLLGVAEFGSPTHEADDIIGTMAARLRATGHLSVLVTRDKDLAQLVRDGDHYWDYAGERRFAYGDIEGHSACGRSAWPTMRVASPTTKSRRSSECGLNGWRISSR